MESRKTSPLGCTINATQVERGLIKWGYVGIWGLTPPPLSSFDYATPHITLEFKGHKKRFLIWHFQGLN
jgi:hypothetical protein